MGRKVVPMSRRAVPVSLSIKRPILDDIDKLSYRDNVSRSRVVINAIEEYLAKRTKEGEECEGTDTKAGGA